MNAPNYTPPVGLSTKLGILTATVGALVAAVTAVLHGDHSPETVTGLLTAAAAVYAVITSRGKQAAAVNGALAAKTPLTPVQSTRLGTEPAASVDISDPALDDPEHEDDEPQFTETDLSGRKDGCCQLEHHGAGGRLRDDPRPGPSTNELIQKAGR